MEIILKGHDAENAVRQIMQLFFAVSDDARVISSLAEKGGIFLAEAKIEFEGRFASGEAQSESADRLSVTNAIKKAVFYAGKKLSDMPTPWGISTGIRPAKTARALLDRGLSEDEIVKSLTGDYLIEEKKARLTLRVAKREQEIIKNMLENSFDLYIGIPFCPSRCSYCSFISRAADHNNKFIEPYVDALLKEIEYAAKITAALGQRPETIYFGGGTPTAIAPHLLERIIESVKENFDLSALREFTVEAGRPDTFSKEMMDMLFSKGVSRISINPQTMHQKTLDKIGRRHSVEDVSKAFYLAREAGIKSINADLIAGLPDEDADMVSYSVEKLLELLPDAVTVHTLYLKRASDMAEDFQRLRFAKNTGSQMDRAADLLEKAHFEPYYMYKQRNTLGNLENVSFAKRGHESLYNIYIMEEIAPIMALGAGGSTKMIKNGDITRVFNPKEAADYVLRIDEVLQRKDSYREYYEK